MKQQLSLFDLNQFTQSPIPNPQSPIYDPAWDEITHRDCDRWNPADFGEVPHKIDTDGQVTIFWEDTQEPPDPDDYENIDAYNQAWREWELLVGEQVKPDTPTPLHPCDCVGEQVTRTTQKFAPQHDKPTHWVEKYWVERSGNKYWYFRYCWMQQRKIHRRYIGSVHSPQAQAKKEMVEIAIADGESPQEIQKIIRANHQS